MAAVPRRARPTQLAGIYRKFSPLGKREGSGIGVFPMMPADGLAFPGWGDHVFQARDIAPSPQGSLREDTMKAATDNLSPRGLNGPMAAVLVALAGAALVVVGLLLVGVRQTQAGEWNPVMSSASAKEVG
jgi:hypothetical protein